MQWRWKQQVLLKRCIGLLFFWGGGKYFSNLVVFHDMSNNECAYNVAEGSQEDHRKGAQCSWRNPALLKTNTFLNCACSAKGRSTVTSQISHWRNNSLDVGSSIINTHIKLTDCLFHLFNHRELKKQQKKLHYRDNRLKCFCVFKFERELGDFLPVCVGVARNGFWLWGDFCVSGEWMGSLQMNQKTRWTQVAHLWVSGAQALDQLG